MNIKYAKLLRGSIIQIKKLERMKEKELLNIINEYQNHFNDFINVDDQDLKAIINRIESKEEVSHFEFNEDGENTICTQKEFNQIIHKLR